MTGSKKRKTLIQKLANHDSRKVPDIPKHYFNRPEVPPPTNFEGKPENPKHYRYKIFLGETIRNRMPFLDSKIHYDYDQLPEFYHERHGRNVHYLPDIFILWVDEANEITYVCDIEINGLIHYKNKNQVLKNIERKNLIYPYLQQYKDGQFKEFKTVASYIIVDVDDFEYQTVSDIFHMVKDAFYAGGLYTKNIDIFLNNYLK